MSQSTNLMNSKSQIRLLLLQNDDHDESISCGLHIRSLDDLPEFVAISYAWGEGHDLRDILIDGKSRKVRSNCFYAICQTRIHHRECFVWIDSICINQDDAWEKGCQVAIMGKIFAAASTVVACIGPDDENSSRVAHYLEDESLKVILRHTDPDKQLESLDQWVQLRGNEWMSKLYLELEQLANRPYWHRLWIVQELFEGGNRVNILCGSRVLAWQTLNLLVEANGLASERYGEDIDYTHLDLFSRLSGDRFEIRELLLYLPQLLCADRRDRIYGLLSLIEWPSDCPAPFPNYNKPVVDLLLETMDLTFPYLSSLGVFASSLMSGKDFNRLQTSSTQTNFPRPRRRRRRWINSIVSGRRMKRHDDQHIHLQCPCFDIIVQKGPGMEYQVIKQGLFGKQSSISSTDVVCNCFSEHPNGFSWAHVTFALELSDLEAIMISVQGLRDEHDFQFFDNALDFAGLALKMETADDDMPWLLPHFLEHHVV